MVHRVAALALAGCPMTSCSCPPERSGTVDIRPVMDAIIAAGLDPSDLDIAEALISLGVRLVAMCHAHIDDADLRRGVDDVVAHELAHRDEGQAALAHYTQLARDGRLTR
jgi:hypothetical protein